jgi:hypothetical protein
MRGNYGGCNIVLLDATSGHVISASEAVRAEVIPSGTHAVTSGNLDDKSDRRISYALGKLAQSDLSSAPGSAETFRAVCSDQSAGALPMCIHGQQGGTVSSSVIILRTPVSESEIWHCQGSPDRRPYVNCSDLFCELGQALTSAER